MQNKFNLNDYVVLLGRIESMTIGTSSAISYGVTLEGDMVPIKGTLINERAIIRVAEPKDFEDSGFNRIEKEDKI